MSHQYKLICSLSACFPWWQSYSVAGPSGLKILICSSYITPSFRLSWKIEGPKRSVFLINEGEINDVFLISVWRRLHASNRFCDWFRLFYELKSRIGWKTYWPLIDLLPDRPRCGYFAAAAMLCPSFENRALFHRYNCLPELFSNLHRPIYLVTTWVWIISSFLVIVFIATTVDYFWNRIWEVYLSLSKNFLSIWSCRYVHIYLAVQLLPLQTNNTIDIDKPRRTCHDVSRWSRASL